MINQLSQETVDEYAGSAQTIVQPSGADWTQGVKVGRTVPAKWWNWLFNAVTKRLSQSKTDSQGILDELKNTVTDAGLTIDPADNTQLAQATRALTTASITEYVNSSKRGYFSRWTAEGVTGLPDFGSATVTVEDVRVIAGSSSPAFYMCLKKHTESPVADYWYYFTSDDLMNWHEIEAPAGAELQSAEIVSYKGRYYFLYSAKDVHSAQLYYSDDLVSWYSSRSFTEYGVLGLRVVNNILWLISASATTYADVSYHSYYTSDGTTWTDAGVVFRNSAGIEDKISEVTVFLGSYIIGNKITADGITWSTMITDWANVAYSRAFITLTNALVLQFSDTEGAWYTFASPSAPPVKKLGTWLFKKQGPDGYILAEDSTDNYAGLTLNADTFTKLSILYPADAKAQFFKVDDIYILGAYKSSDLSTWEAITMPAGTTVPEYSGIGFYIIAGNYFSKDAGTTWEEGMCVGVPFCAVPVYISESATCMTVVASNNVVQRRLTFNGVNRVIGTTLYLK